jgi:SOS-response transcriptional repressor LexA
MLLAMNLTKRWLSQQLGVNHVTISDILEGSTKRPRDPKVWEKMLFVLGREQAERTATLERAGTVAAIGRSLRRLPVLATITAGDPWAQWADVDYEEIPDWGYDFQRWGRKVEGDSMANLLLPGDIAVFENRAAKPNDVIHAYCDGEDTVKCLRGHGEAAQLVPFNPDFPAFSARGWKVKGVCVARIRYTEFGVRSFVDFRSGLTWGMRDLKV